MLRESRSPARANNEKPRIGPGAAVALSAPLRRDSHGQQPAAGNDRAAAGRSRSWSGCSYWSRSRRSGPTGFARAARRHRRAAAPVTPTPRRPPPARGGSGADPREIIQADIYFDFKSARLRADAGRLLQETAGGWTSAAPGSCWSRATPIARGRRSTTGLAKRRANTVKQFLMDLGVPETPSRST